MTPDLAADFVLYLHCIYVGVVVLSVPLILVGGLCRWRWVRNRWYRLTHVGMIGIVVAESLFGIRCPLTNLEHTLRYTTPSAADGGAFIPALMEKLIFWHLPHAYFTVLYLLFGAAVLSLFYFVPISSRPAHSKDV